MIPILAFLACAGVYAEMPAPLSADDTLVAIPVLRMSLRTSDSPVDVSYQINIENAETGMLFPLNFDVGDNRGYRFVRGIPPGQYLVRDFASYGLVNSPNRPLRVQKTLVVEKGKLALLPIKAISIIHTRKLDDVALYSIDFIEYDDSQRGRMLDILGKDENFAKWGQ